jgi:hypothetical protein
MIKNQNGNVFVYILIAVALFGALMFVLSKSASQEDVRDDLSEGRYKIAANEILSYAAATENAIVQMQQSGATVDQIDFMLPSDADFNTAPNIYKLFHPDGGALVYKPLPDAAKVTWSGAAPKPGYYVGRFNNVTWTPTTAQDVIFTAYNIKKEVCAQIDKKVIGSTTIPATSAVSIRLYTVDDDLYTTGSNVAFTKTVCPVCEDISEQCVAYTFSGSTFYVFYSILQAE